MRLLQIVGGVLLAVTTACSSQSVTTPADTPPDVDPSADAGDTADLSSITLVHGASTAVVDVAALPTQMLKGSPVVPLTAVWTAGGLADASGLQFDFEGDDGFHPSSKSKCAAFIAGATLVQGYVLPATRTLVWDDALGLPGCYSVHGVSKMIGLPASVDAGAP
jgi:hypothetical protein